MLTLALNEHSSRWYSRFNPSLRWLFAFVRFLMKGFYRPDFFFVKLEVRALA